MSKISEPEVPTNLGDDLLYDEKIVAKITGRSVRSIQGDRLNGKGIPFIKFGGSVRYRGRTIKQYLDECERRSTSETGVAS